MKLLTQSFAIDIDTGLLPAPCGDVLFFDIETTGFSAESACVYLIGCIYYEQDGWKLTQFFLEERSGEKELLTAFFAFIEPYRFLIQFNGRAFDMPFLEKRAKKLGISGSFDGFDVLDLYKELRGLKDILGLTGLKQKDLEIFLDIRREDTYSGGELIQVYEAYLYNRRPDYLDALLLHNADDLRGMLSLLSMRSYALFFSGGFSLIKASEQVFFDENHMEYQILRLDFDVPHAFPKPFSCQKPSLRLSGNNRTACLSVLMHTGILKHFYKDYKAYYYLPLEDYAIHKDAAVCVDKKSREKAKASNCYMKKSAAFLPYPLPDTAEIFQEEYNSTPLYFEATEMLWTKEEFLLSYPKHLIQIVIT